MFHMKLAADVSFSFSAFALLFGQADLQEDLYKDNYIFITY